jgi:hypothetical protein
MFIGPVRAIELRWRESSPWAYWRVHLWYAHFKRLPVLWRKLGVFGNFSSFLLMGGLLIALQVCCGSAEVPVVPPCLCKELKLELRSRFLSKNCASGAAPSVLPLSRSLYIWKGKLGLIEMCITKDDNFIHRYGYPWVPYPCGHGMCTLLYP